MSDVKLNKPWEWCDLWDNESQFLAWLRGQLRQIWMDYPVRIEFKESKCVPVTPALRKRFNLHGSTRMIAECVHCHQWFPKTKLEVDHIVGESSLKSMEDIVNYLNHLMCSPDNMQLSCVPCHKIKTYAERYGVSFEDATLEKKVIEWEKGKGVNEQKSILILAGFKDSDVKNKVNRRNSIRELLTIPEE